MNNGIKLEYNDTVVDVEAYDDFGIPSMAVTIASDGCYKYDGLIYEQGEKHKEWAEAIATRIADESSYNKKTKEDLQGALETAFLNSSKAMSMLIGTEIIEEDYFEKLD